LSGATTLSTTKFNIKTFSVLELFAIFSINDTLPLC
jgi:hypothetical protein